MKGLWMGSSFCVGRGGDQVMDIYLCGMGLSGRAYHEEPKGASSKRFWYLKESYHEVFKNIWQ